MADVDMTGVDGPSSQTVGPQSPEEKKTKSILKGISGKKLTYNVDSDDDDDDDPIVCSYDIYIKPKARAERQFVIMQFPNRDVTQAYNDDSGMAPTAIRMKPKAGMFEMDVPVDPWHNYDRTKGVKMGDALHKSEKSKGVGSHGLAGGFGIGAQPPSSRGRQKTAANEDKSEEAKLSNWEESIERKQVLAKQTLGGQSVAKDGVRPQYMMGVFRDDQLHLTPVDHLVQMRPQFHHVDAYYEAEKIKLAREGPRTTPARAQEARAVHLTAKSTIDGEEEQEDTMAERIAAVQAEQWQSFLVVDENSEEAWKAYDENMFVGADKGLKTSEELRAGVPKLRSVWSNKEYLDALAPKRTTTKVKEKKGKGKGAADVEGEDDFDLDNLDDTDSE